MRVIGLNRLHKFCLTHADCRKWVANWIGDVRVSQWKNTHDVRAKYPSASFLANNTVIFNVRGNEYRLEAQIAYGVGTVAVSWIGNHAEYSQRYK